MLTVPESFLDSLEQKYPGIKDQVLSVDAADLPPCDSCGSSDTATVQCGLVGRSINVGGCTSKLKLIPNGPGPGLLWCNGCESFFG